MVVTLCTYISCMMTDDHRISTGRLDVEFMLVIFCQALKYKDELDRRDDICCSNRKIKLLALKNSNIICIISSWWTRSTFLDNIIRYNNLMFQYKLIWWERKQGIQIQ